MSNPILDSITCSLQALELEAKKLNEALLANQQQQNALKLQAIEIHHRVKIGSIVLYRGKLWEVTDIEPRDYNRTAKPWVKGRTRRKDGSWSMKPQLLFHTWELVPEQKGQQ
jgi:hypothetical protein